MRDLTSVHPLDLDISAAQGFDLEIEEVPVGNHLFDNCLSSGSSASTAASSTGGSSSLSSAGSLSSYACFVSTGS